MGKKLYVRNFTFNTTEEQLGELFRQHGQVDSVKIITDRETGRSKGFGFVEMSSDSEADKAISALNGATIDGRALTVNEARPQEDRPRGPGGPGGGRGGPRSGGPRPGGPRRF